MAEKKMQNQKKQSDRKKVQFIVRREFAGQQTMREAFETCEQFEDWLERRAS